MFNLYSKAQIEFGGWRCWWRLVAAGAGAAGAAAVGGGVLLGFFLGIPLVLFLFG